MTISLIPASEGRRIALSQKKAVFRTEQVRQLQQKMLQISEETNLLRQQLNGQVNGWSSGLPVMGAVSSAQQLANRLTEDAEKLADVLRKAILGVERVQLENERGASDWAHKAQSLTKLVGYLQIQAGSAIAHIPQQLRQAATHLIDRVVDLFERDELYNDPIIRQLDWLARNQGLPVEERIKLKRSWMQQSRNGI